MAIKSTLGNMSYSVQDTLSSILTTTKTQIGNIVGSVSTSLSNIWQGGFTGMSESGFAELKTQLSNYCNDVQGLIDGFDQTGDITSALKGDVQTAAYEFIGAIKELLKAYVSRMRQEISEADEAYANFLQSSQSISQDVQSAAQEIRTNASQIKLD